MIDLPEDVFHTTDDPYDTDDADPRDRFGLYAGAFDPFPHPGHVLAINDFINHRGRDLVHHTFVHIALHIDPSSERQWKQQPFMTIEERLVMLSAIKGVVTITTYNTEAELHETLLDIKPDYRILGDDYKDREYTGDNLRIPVFYANRSHGWSSRDFVARIQFDQRLDDTNEDEIVHRPKGVYNTRLDYRDDYDDIYGE